MHSDQSQHYRITASPTDSLTELASNMKSPHTKQLKDSQYMMQTAIPPDKRGDQDQQHEEDADQWVFTREQLVAFGTDFSARFYAYVNSDKMHIGLAHGVTPRLVPDEVRPPSDDSISSILN
jgi:hypothetical protein